VFGRDRRTADELSAGVERPPRFAGRHLQRVQPAVVTAGVDGAGPGLDRGAGHHQAIGLERPLLGAGRQVDAVEVVVPGAEERAPVGQRDGALDVPVSVPDPVGFERPPVFEVGIGPRVAVAVVGPDDQVAGLGVDGTRRVGVVRRTVVLPFDLAGDGVDAEHRPARDVVLDCDVHRPVVVGGAGPDGVTQVGLPELLAGCEVVRVQYPVVGADVHGLVCHRGRTVHPPAGVGDRRRPPDLAAGSDPAQLAVVPRDDDVAVRERDGAGLRCRVLARVDGDRPLEGGRPGDGGVGADALTADPAAELCRRRLRRGTPRLVNAGLGLAQQVRATARECAGGRHACHAEKLPAGDAVHAVCLSPPDQ